MSKALRTAGTIIAGVALVATGVGALAGAGLLGASAGALAASAGAWTLAGISVQTLGTIGAGMAFLGDATAKPLKVGGVAGSQVDFAADPNAPIPYVVGRTGTGGRIIYASTGEVKNRNILYNTALSFGPIQGFDGFKAADEAVTFSPFTEAADGGTYNLRMWQRRQLGAKPSAALLPPNTLDSAVLSEWTSEHKTSGYATAWYVLGYDQKTYPSGVPEAVWTIEGALVYDPREDDTYPGGEGDQRADDEATWQYSENPWLHALAWSRGRYANGVRVLGIGAPLSALGVAACVEAANVADANSWRVGGVVYSNDSKWDVLKAMCQAGGGRPVRLGASISFLVNAPRVSLATLTADDIVGGYSVQAAQSVRGRPNQIIPKYRSEAHGWEVVSAGPVKVAAYVTADRRLRSREVAYPLVQDAAQVAQLAAYDLVNGREFGPVTVSCKPQWMGFKGGDCITVDVPDLAMNGQKALILTRTVDPMTGDVSLTLQSETDAKHDYALGRTGSPPPIPGLTALPEAPDAPDIADWSAAGETFTDNGQSIPAIVVSGSVDDPHVTRLLTDYRPSGTSVWASAPVVTLESADPVRLEITSVTRGTTYDVRIAFQSVRGVQSEWTTLPDATAGDFSLDEITASFADGDITPGEKLYVVPWIKSMVARRTGLRDRADALSLDYADNLERMHFEDAADELDTQLAALTTPVDWDDASDVTEVSDPAALRAALEAAQSTADALEYEILTAYGTSIADLDTKVDGLLDAVSDGLLTTGEKLTFIPGTNSLVFARAALRTRATALGLTVGAGNAERIAFEAAATALDSLLATLTSPVAWNNTTDVTTIPDAGDFRDALEDAYLTTWDLQSKIDGQPTGGTYGVDIYETFGGSLATLSNFKTILGIAASIAGQASAATDATIESGSTKNLLYFQSSSPSSPSNGALWCDTTTSPFVWKIRISGSWQAAASYGGEFGTSLWEAAGVLATNANYKTASGTAAAVTGQTSWATTTLFTPTQIGGKTQYFDPGDGKAYDYRVGVYNLSVDGTAGRYSNPLSASVGSISVASHSIYLPGYSGVTTLSIPSTSFSGLSDDTNYTIFYRPDYGDWFPIVSAGAAAYKTSRDGYLEIGTIATPTSGGTWVAPTTDFTSTGRYGYYDCVAADAVLPGGKVAGEAGRGDELVMMAPGGDLVVAGKANAVRLAKAHCLTLRTANGGKITVSRTAPLMTRKGEGFLPHAIDAHAAVLGCPIPTLGDGGKVEWSELVGISPAGLRDVAMISAMNGVYAAADADSAVMVFTHNMYNKP